MELKSKTKELGGAVRRAYCNSSRQGSTGSRPTATAANHTTRTGTCSAADIAVRPAGTETSDSAGSIASGAAREWTGHGLVVHHWFHENRSSQHAQTGRQLVQHHRTHWRYINKDDEVGKREKARGLFGRVIIFAGLLKMCWIRIGIKWENEWINSGRRIVHVDDTVYGGISILISLFANGNTTGIF